MIKKITSYYDSKILWRRPALDTWRKKLIVMQPRFPVTLTKIVQALLKNQTGKILLGNVIFSWNGVEVSWDLPPDSWDIDGMWQDIIAHSEHHPKIELIAFIEYTNTQPIR